MDKRTAKIFMDGKIAECIEDFPHVPPLDEEAAEELGKIVLSCLEQIQSPDELWAILQATEYSLDEVLNDAMPIHGTYGGRPLSHEGVEIGVKFCILHNIIYYRCIEQLPEKIRRDHGIPS